MKNFPIVAAALLTGTAALAQTEPAAPPAPPALMAHPMADKAMNRSEVVTMVRDHFGRIDSDKDGAVTKDEMLQGHEKMAMHIKHGPGGPHGMKLERRDPKKAFERLDANKDGAISYDEFAKGHEERIEKRIEIRELREQAAKDGKQGGKREMRLHRMGGRGGERIIVMADSDNDGKITLAEAEAKALEHFDKMDANKDGQVTPEERRAGRPLIIKKVIEEKKTAS